MSIYKYCARGITTFLFVIGMLVGSVGISATVIQHDALGKGVEVTEPIPLPGDDIQASGDGSVLNHGEWRAAGVDASFWNALAEKVADFLSVFTEIYNEVIEALIGWLKDDPVPEDT